MSTIETTAIYQNGVLRLTESLGLAEQSAVRITVHVPETAQVTVNRNQVQDALARAGLSRPSPDLPPLPAPLPEARREELALLFARGGPLSALIVEERAKQP